MYKLIVSSNYQLKDIYIYIYMCLNKIKIDNINIENDSREINIDVFE